MDRWKCSERQYAAAETNRWGGLNFQLHADPAGLLDTSGSKNALAEQVVPVPLAVSSNQLQL